MSGQELIDLVFFGIFYWLGWIHARYGSVSKWLALRRAAHEKGSK